MQSSLSMESAKFTLLNKLQTGNLVYDFVISSILLMLITTLTNKIYIISDILSHIQKRILCKKKHVQISYSCTEFKSNYNGIKMEGSNSFKALLFHIKNKIRENKVKNLYDIKEFSKGKKYDYDDNNYLELEEALYIVNQYEEFELIGNIDNNIIYKFTSHESEHKDDERNVKTEKTYTLTIRAKNPIKTKLSDLQNYVDELTKKYLDKIETHVNENQYIFQYEGYENDCGVYKMYPFYTTCTLDKLYFDEKENIIKQIDFFINRKDWYIKRGKPYTFGICIHGLPGTGKTSFEKAIAKKLNRHLIIVDISKIKSQREADSIFFSEKINGFKIPYDKRIYIFPDFDSMLPEVTNKRKSITKEKKEKDINIENIKKCIADELKKKNKKENSSENDMNISLPDIDDKLNLSKLLNLLDGIPERTGQIIIIDTNFPENLDDAIIRPGRIDHMIEFKKMNKKNMKNLLLNYFEIDNYDIDFNNLPDRKITPAELFRLCSSHNDIDNVLRRLKSMSDK